MWFLLPSMVPILRGVGRFSRTVSLEPTLAHVRQRIDQSAWHRALMDRSMSVTTEAVASSESCIPETRSDLRNWQTGYSSPPPPPPYWR